MNLIAVSSKVPYGPQTIRLLAVQATICPCTVPKCLANVNRLLVLRSTSQNPDKVSPPQLTRPQPMVSPREPEYHLAMYSFLLAIRSPYRLPIMLTGCRASDTIQSHARTARSGVSRPEPAPVARGAPRRGCQRDRCKAGGTRSRRAMVGGAGG